MAFNHYAKLKGIIDQLPDGWFIKCIHEPTEAKNFQGKTVRFDHYYRIYSREGLAVKFGKFQQIDRLAQALKVPIEALPVIE